MSGTNVSSGAKLFLPILFVAVLGILLGACGGGGNSSSNSNSSKKNAAQNTSPSGSSSSNSPSTNASSTVAPAATTTGSTSGLANKTVQLSESRKSGVSGKATFTNTKGGVRVVLSMKNLSMNIEKPGTEHLAHIHQPGTCGGDRAGKGAPVEYPLKPLYTKKDGSGTSTTVIKKITVSSLFSGAPKYVNVHAMKKGSGVPPGISCGDISNILGG